MLNNAYIANTHAISRYSTNCIVSLVLRHYPSLKINVTVFESFEA